LSTAVIWGLVFLTGLGTCGIEAGYFNQSTGTASYAGVFAACADTFLPSLVSIHT